MCMKCERSFCICLGPVKTDAIVKSYTQKLERALTLRNLPKKDADKILDVLWKFNEWSNYKDVEDIAQSISQAVYLSWRWTV